MKKLLLTAIISANLLLPVNSHAEETLEVMSAEELENRIQGREALEKAQGADEFVEEPVPEFSPPTGDSVADIIARQSYLEEEMRRLYGQISQLNFQVKNLTSQIEAATATANAAKTASEKSLSAAAEQYVSRPGDVNEQYVIKVDGAEVKVDAATETPAVDMQMKEETDFNAAIALISEQNLKAAKDKFNKFIKDYPSSTRMADAFFWMGEINMDDGQFKDSALNYLKSYKADKNGKRAEEALLKSSTALGKLGKKAEACKNLSTLRNMEGLQDLIKEQANSEAIKLGCK